MKRERCSKTNTYIIDEEYRLQYVSEGLSEKFPELRLGGVCYQEFRGHDQPCTKKERPICSTMRISKDG